MKILVVPYNYPTSSFPVRASFVADQVRALREHGHSVEVIAVLPRTISDVVRRRKANNSNVKPEEGVSSYPAIRGFYRFNSSIQFYILKIRLLQKLKKDKANDQLPDVVHVHNAVSAKIAIWVQKNFGIPFVITEHSSSMWNYDAKSDPLKLNEAILTSKANMAVSKDFARHLSKLFGCQFHYVPNAIDTAFFRRPDKFIPCSAGREIRLISVGNLTKNKNHQLAIRAVKYLVDQDQNIHYTIIGTGTELSHLSKLVVELGLEERVFFVGHLSREKVKQSLLESERFLLPSISETFGVALVEAMSCGLPVMAIDNGGSNSIILSQSVGVIARDEEDFYSKIRPFILKEYDHQTISNFANEHFSYSAVAAKIQALY